VGVLKFPKLGLPRLWGPIILRENLRLRWGPKESYNPRWKISSDMWHTTYTQGNRSDSRLLIVESQIANLIPDLSFDHNLCFKCPNGSCEPILDIYVLKTFQWYKELLNPMSFDPCNHPLKVWESIVTPTLKVRVHLKVWGFNPSHSFALPRAWYVIPEFTFGSQLRKPLLWSRAQG
jgi:hypothetical protein